MASLNQQLYKIRAFFAVALLSACAHTGDGAAPAFQAEIARFDARVFLSARGPDLPNATFEIAAPNVQETVVAFSSNEPYQMRAAISCEGPARLRLDGPGDPGLFLRAGAERQFMLPSRYETVRPELRLPPDTQKCLLTWGDSNRLPLVRVPHGSPATSGTADCTGPLDGADPLAQAFFASRNLSQTCAQPTGSFELYPDEIESLRLSLGKLTGSSISREALLAGDPDMVLDFTNAPKFDQIVLSYLHFRADLTGYLIARALAFHASRGTDIRIAVSRSLVLPLDRKLFDGLASQYPNIQIQRFAWGPPFPDPLGAFIGLFRSHHAKLFAGLSAEPGASFALVGGRNLHDGFFFPGLENRADRPYLHDYDAFKLNPLAYLADYEDFEIGLFDQKVVASIVSHFAGFWTRDARTQTMRPVSGGTTGRSDVADDGVVRHYLSLPWTDARGQEQYFVDLIDAAEHEVLAIAPFIYPTSPIDEALLRAAERGVNVLLISRIGSGEPIEYVVGPTITRYAAFRGDKFRIIDYSPPDRLMHTKLLVIDERLGIVTASNLNQRSFVHDTENGLVFLDREVARQLKAVIEKAAAKGETMQISPALLLGGLVFGAVPLIGSFF